MICKNCGKELRNGAKFCTECGMVVEETKNDTSLETAEASKTINAQCSVLTIHGYSDWYAVTPSVEIYENNMKIGEVKYKDTVEIQIKKDTVITFKCMMRKATYRATSGQNKEIALSFNRITGQLVVNEGNTSASIISSNNDISKINNANVPTANSCGKKNKNIAGILAIILGGLGIHKFYMGNAKMGVIYLLFCWTYIPSIVSFVEGLMYLCETDEKFESRCS